MNRKLVAIVVLLVLIVTVPVLLYFHFRPEPVSASLNLNNNDLYDAQYMYEEFKVSNVSEQAVLASNSETVKTTAPAHVLFIANNDTDSSYVENSMLKLLAMESINALPKITKIDTSNVKNLTVTQLKNKYQIEKTPAFVVYEVVDGKIVVIETLVYHQDEPFTKDELKQWFYTHGLWNGPLEN